MNKSKFLENLESKLTVLNVMDKEEVISYYDELISDRIDNGITEEEAVKKLGSINDIIVQVLVANNETEKEDAVITDVVKKVKEKTSTMPRWLFITLVSTAIIWVPVVLGLGIGLFSAALGIFAALAAVLITLLIVPFAVAIGLALGGPLMIFASIAHLVIYSNIPLALFNIGMGIISIGLSIILIPITIAFAKLIVKVLKKISNSIYIKYRTIIARKGVSRNEN